MANELLEFLAPDGGSAPSDPPPLAEGTGAAPPEGSGDPPDLKPAPDTGAAVPDGAKPDGAKPDDPPETIPDDLRGTREALIAERTRRKDYKGQADRLTGELTATKAELELLRKAAVAPPAPAVPATPAAPEARPAPSAVPNILEDPAGYHAYTQRVMFNERLNLSEAMLREKHDDVDEKVAIWKKAADANPALAAQLQRQAHPYSWMYNEAVKLAAMDEIGSDPAAYRAKVEAEIRAALEAEGVAPIVGAATPPVRIPRSLATVPSSGARTAVVPDAPEFEDIFRRPQKRA